MKKAYENPVAEKIVFDYTNTVTASGGGLNLLGTSDEQWCHTGTTTATEQGSTSKCVK